VGLLVLQELSKSTSKRQTARRDVEFNMVQILPKPTGKYETNYDFVMPMLNRHYRK
jgi:hypothetical protein